MMKLVNELAQSAGLDISTLERFVVPADCGTAVFEFVRNQNIPVDDRS